MPTATSAATRTNMLTIDRKRFLTALTRINRVVPTRTVKPILQGVHLKAADGELQLRADGAFPGPRGSTDRLHSQSAAYWRPSQSARAGHHRQKRQMSVRRSEKT